MFPRIKRIWSQGHVAFVFNVFCFFLEHCSMAKDVASLEGILQEFRSEYHIANNRAVADFFGTGWDGVWNAVTRACAADLMDPKGDPFVVRRRLERLADVYRRSVCDPVRLFASLVVQDTVSQHMATLERWCEEHPLTTVCQGGVEQSAPSKSWRIMCENELIFTGWSASMTVYDTRLPCNLYANPHHGADRVESFCLRSRQLLLSCALAEAKRLIRGPMQEEGIPSDEWTEYQKRVWLMCKGMAWIDIDSVARTFCGYPYNADSFDSYGAWREPLLRADRVLHQLLEQLDDSCIGILRTWLQDVCRCPATYIGVRFPPSFVALLSDIILQECPCVMDVTESTNQDPSPHPLQVYSVWVRFGMVYNPILNDITQGWDTNEQQFLVENGNRFTTSVFQFWRANRGV
jgi:hypothetical protein